LIYRHTALVHATYSINVVFLAITKAASPLLARTGPTDRTNRVDLMMSVARGNPEVAVRGRQDRF